MQDVLTVTVVLAGLFFSISCALLLEELMFGLFFRALTPRRKLQTKIPTLSGQNQAGRGWRNQKDATEGGVSCSH